MKILRILALGLIWLATMPLQAQFGANPGTGLGLPYFQLKVISTFDSETGERIARIYAQIRNENLTFLKNDSGYVAELQMDLYVADTKNDYAYNKTINKKLLVEDYDSTVSPEITNTFTVDLPVKPGKYELKVAVSDRNSSNQFNRSLKFEVDNQEDIRRRVLLSDMIFFNDYQTNSEGKIIAFQPAMNNAFASESDFIYAYFTTYNFHPETLTEVRYTVKDENNIPVLEHHYEVETKEPFSEHFLKLSRYYLDRNHYTLELMVHNGDQWIIKNAVFTFFWRFVPSTLHDLDLALKQLRYISPDDSIGKVLKMSYADKKAYFERFWKQRDPDPSTPRNELMEEYYRRVNFANANFATSTAEGWVTDRGRIFIKFGEPDEIERHPFEPDSAPYQIWRYYSLQKVFLFIDRTGFGDYDLHPSYYYVEYD